MPGEYANSDQFRGARIQACDLAGLEIRDCEVSGLKIVDCIGGDVSLGGHFERLVVNDVDVTAYVEGELDRHHPARVLARDATTADDYRAAWDAIEALWELRRQARSGTSSKGALALLATLEHAGDALIDSGPPADAIDEHRAKAS